MWPKKKKKKKGKKCRFKKVKECHHNSQVKVLFVLLLLLLSRLSPVPLCATPQTAAHQAPPSLGCSRQEHWSGLPFPSPMRESEVLCHVQLLATPWTAAYQAPPSVGFPGKSTGVGCHCLLCLFVQILPICKLKRTGDWTTGTRKCLLRWSYMVMICVFWAFSGTIGYSGLSL